MGPTAIASILTFQIVQGRSPEYAILLSFLSGIIELLMGFFGLGFLVDFVSGPVSSGFTSAAALIILTSQVKDLLGIKASGSTFVQTWTSIISNIHGLSGWDTFLGAASIIVLLLMRLMTKIKFGPEETSDSAPNKFQKFANATIWIISTSRNAILVVVCGFIGYFLFTSYEDVPVKLIGDIPSGLPEIKVPAFSMNSGNTTTSFLDMLATLGSGVILVPLLALLEDIAICKAFANGKSIDATQELLSIGVSNVATSFFQGFPITGALSRSAVLNSSGARTPFNGFYTGVLVIAALLFFTPYFFYIPKASLAAIIIAAVIFMVEVKVVRPMWRCKKSDFFLALATFVACLVLALEVGILVGIGMNLLFILYYAARPKITIEKLVSSNGIEYLMLTPDRCLIFPSVDYVRNLVTKHSVRQEIPVVIDCSHIYGADYTAATV
ncbi:sodium-independent sulfate anion transporter-like [Agrilus planipennis]|nr:sodium-independent sulfate anion transporter-like [Agrilus planipennis]